MDLRTGTPLWTTLSPAPASGKTLSRDETCDVLVIGSGVTGAMAAFHLAEAGLDVVQIDRRPIARGSTPASTALIQYEIDQPLVSLAQLIGPVDAQAVYRQTRQTLDDMAHLVARAKIDCDLIQRPTLYLAHRAADRSLLKEETQARQAVDIEVSYIDGDELQSTYRIDRLGAIRSEMSYELDPWKLTVGLLAASARLGVRQYGETELDGHPATDQCRPVRTTEGRAIRFKHVLFATGYETPEQFASIAALTTLKSTYALATPPVDPARFWTDRALLWERAEPYFYARTTADDRILIGGEDEPFADAERRDALIESKTQTLLKKLADATGIEIDRADFTWAGTFAETADGLPYIGRAPEAPHCLLALGYGGNGITYSLLAAQILRDAVLGNEHPNARRFGFDRPAAQRALRHLA